MKFKNFYKKYNHSSVEDDNSMMSKEAKSFFKNMTSALKTELAQKNIAVAKVNYGHYDVSYFLENEQHHFVYLSYSVPRGGYPINLDSYTPLNGFLCRTAASLTDYTGGQNRFCAWNAIPELVELLMR